MLNTNEKREPLDTLVAVRVTTREAEEFRAVAGRKGGPSAVLRRYIRRLLRREKKAA